jgi:predicted membrane channel-forming protein YqfA (hemolysin III family)
MTGAGPAAAGLLYDARRGAYYTRPALRGWLHLDQAVIFFLIAGSATPAFLITAPTGAGLACLIAMWAVTITAIAVRLARASTPELAAGALEAFHVYVCAAAGCQYAPIARFTG